MLDRLIDEELLVQRGLTLGLARTDRRVRADLTHDGDRRRRQRGQTTASRARPSSRRSTTRTATSSPGPAALRVRQVFVRVTAPSDPAALARAEQAAQRLRAGESVDAVQAALGDPPLSPLPDALLPPAKLRDYLGPTALRTALELDVGEVSDPVRSGTGYHVLQVVERQADTAPTLADIRPQVVAELRRRQASEQALRTYLDELRGARRRRRARAAAVSRGSRLPSALLAGAVARRAPAAAHDRTVSYSTWEIAAPRARVTRAH